MDYGFYWIRFWVKDDGESSSIKPFLNSLPTSFFVAVDPEQIQKTSLQPRADAVQMESIRLKGLVTREAYIQSVLKLKQHIQQGDIYEVNYCIPFVAEDISLHPATVFHR